jgi:nicotinate-nucleotide adenylyltransferase
MMLHNLYTSMPTVGIFGGSFNPPHIAHLIVAETVRDQFGLDRVLWIPNYSPPHKSDGDLAMAEDRYAMTEQAISGYDRFEISAIELTRGGTSYTIDTLQQLQKDHPDTMFSLIIGSDSLRTFVHWHEADAIAAMLPIIVYKRPGGLSGVVEPRFANQVRFADAPLLEVSGSEIRARFQQGRSIRYLVPDAVRTYIQNEGLYAG